VQTLHVAAALDLLADGPMPVDRLAVESGADRPSLYRLLRMLAATGAFREEPDGRFSLTPLGATLRSGEPDSIRDWALYVGAPETWEARAACGESGFVLAHGRPSTTT